MKSGYSAPTGSLTLNSPVFTSTNIIIKNLYRQDIYQQREKLGFDILPVPLYHAELFEWLGTIPEIILLKVYATLKRLIFHF